MQIVLVKWLAATAGDDGWVTTEAADQLPPKICYAAGALVTENKEKVTLALLVADDMLSVNMTVTIPADLIVKMKVLGEIDEDFRKD